MSLNNSPDGLICLEGTIAHYSERVEQGQFQLSAGEDSKITAVTVIAAVMGQGAIAAGTYSQRNQTEPAYFVQFMLGSKVCKGWVWVSLFKNGDHVRIAAERNAEGYYELYAIYRPEDGMIALFPHCLRGRKAHYRASFKYSVYFFLFFLFFELLFMTYVTGGDVLDTLYLTAITGLAGIIPLSLISYSLIRKWMIFIKLSEKIFKTFGFKDVENIDLPKLTQQSIKEGEMGSAAIGLYIFRYLQDVSQ